MCNSTSTTINSVSVEDCAGQCVGNGVFNVFNYIPSTRNCTCDANCEVGVISQPGTNVYTVGNVSIHS